MSESTEQIAVVEWFRFQYPDVPLIAYPSGMWLGHDNKRKFGLINKFKKEGWISGVSDLILFHSDGQHHGLCLEMKNFGKKISSLSDSQILWMTTVEKQGYLAKWADGFEKAKVILTDYMNGHYRTANAK